MDLRSGLKDVNHFCLFVSFFGHAKYQDDSLWEFLIGVVERTYGTMNFQALSDIISGLGEVKRGSEELWSNLLEATHEKIFEATLDNKITIFRGVLMKGHQNDYWLQEARKEILSQNSLQGVSKAKTKFGRIFKSTALKTLASL